MLGKYTMYRLILLVLAALAVYSLLLNALGWLTFGIPQMLVHLALCLGLTYASNRALAALFHVRPHSESSLITGLLLYFLFWPSFVPMDVAGVALACVLASASKYALAWRGRHIFNPAVTGAFVTGLTGLNVATWWAATPAMLWLLVPGILLVLYRTRKFLMAAVFLVVATSIVASELLQAGMTLGGALWQALAQRPLLFFVGFMLTEPLTLPPRRWQQLALAAVVGVVFAVPYNFGFIANSPELALLVGNLLAFLVGQRGGLKLTFTGSRALTPSTTEFAFEPSRPVRFIPGQYMELDLPHATSDGKGRRRVFSLTSAPGSETVTFGVRTSEPLSAAKKVLLALKPGDHVAATSVGGDFVLPRDPRTPVLLIAAGIGITPYLAHLAVRRRPGTAMPFSCSSHGTPGRSPTPGNWKRPVHGSLPASPMVPSRRRSLLTPRQRCRRELPPDPGWTGLAEGSCSGYCRPHRLRLRVPGERRLAAPCGQERRCAPGPCGLVFRLLRFPVRGVSARRAGSRATFFIAGHLPAKL